MAKTKLTRKIDRCLVCGTTDLLDGPSFGFHAVNDFPAVNDKKYKPMTCEISLSICDRCTHVQQSETLIDPSSLYTSGYWYKSGTSRVIKTDLYENAAYLHAKEYMTERSAILDIGCNDGTFLDAVGMVNRQTFRVGVDPSPIDSPGLQHRIKSFWGTEEAKDAVKNILPAGKKGYDVITALGMMYDSENPLTFLKHAADCLSPGGIVVVQLMAFDDMFAMNDVGNLCHEHLSFFTIDSMNHLVWNAGLTYETVKKTPVNGLSTWMTLKKRPTSKHETYPYSPPIRHGHEVVKRCEKFKERAVLQAKHLASYLEVCKSRGQLVPLLGASTKGNTVLQFLEQTTMSAGELKTYLPVALEIDPTKVGRRTVCTNIPIFSQEEWLGTREGQDDYPKDMVVLPYGIVEDLRHGTKPRLREFRERGGRLVTVSPRFSILDGSNRG